MEFYVVINHAFDKTGFAYAEQKGKINTGNALKCEECGSFLTMLEWLPPLEVKLSTGKLGDVIFGTYSHFIVSEKFKELYCKNGFKGILSFTPVTMYRKGTPMPDSYYYPKIVLSNVHTDIESSGIIFDGTKECSTCQKAGRIIKKMKGFYISGEEKAGNDIFCTKMLPGTILFSEQFKIAAKDLTYLSFIEAEKYVPISIF